MAPHKFEIECVEATQETATITSFVFRRTDGQRLVFRPGQYLNVAFPAGEDGALVDRNYSISSTPFYDGGHLVRLTIKREPHGLVSQWAHENLRPGTVLEALGPLGSFHLLDSERRARFLLLAAGVGITPILSMALTFQAMPGSASIVIIYHASTRADFALAQELQALMVDDPRVTVHMSLGDTPDPSWEGLSGRLDAGVVESLVPDAIGRKVLACGPAGYLERVAQVVADLRVSPNAYLTESFTGSVQTLEVAEAAPPVAFEEVASSDAFADSLPEHIELAEYADAEGAAAVPAEVPIPPREPEDTRAWATFARTGRSVPVEPGQTLLDAGIAAGIPLRSNCADGMCGTCKVRTLAGEVTMHHAGGIREREIRDGMILPCCSRPEGDVVLEA